MARIKIEDLPKDMKISKEEMKKVVGGALLRKTVIDSGLRAPVLPVNQKGTISDCYLLAALASKASADPGFLP